MKNKTPDLCSVRGCEAPRVGRSNWCAEHAEQFATLGRQPGEDAAAAPVPAYLQGKLHKPVEAPAPAPAKRRGRPPGSSNRCTVGGCKEPRVKGANRCEHHLEVAKKTEASKQKRAHAVEKAKKAVGAPTTTPHAAAAPMAEVPVTPRQAKVSALTFARQDIDRTPPAALPKQDKWNQRLYSEYLEYRREYLREHTTAPAYLMWLETQVRSSRIENEALASMIKAELESLVDLFEGAHELLSSAMELAGWNTLESSGWEAVLVDGALTIERVRA